jgi:hypothetical protein
MANKGIVKTNASEPVFIVLKKAANIRIKPIM